MDYFKRKVSGINVAKKIISVSSCRPCCLKCSCREKAEYLRLQALLVGIRRKLPIGWPLRGGRATTFE